MEKFSSPIRKSVLSSFKNDYTKIIENNPKLRASKLYQKFKKSHPDMVKSYFFVINSMLIPYPDIL